MRAAVDCSGHITPAVGADAPLVAHVIYRLDVGGLENGLINLINRIPPERYRHAIICLTDHSEFKNRIRRHDVPVYSLHKPPGRSPTTHLRLWRLLRQLRPDIVHTRNLPALEAVLTAALAGVPIRIHGEHGRDVTDLDGGNRKYRFWRRIFRPFVHQYIALSQELEHYLCARTGVPRKKVAHVYNGVDTEIFHPASNGREALPLSGFAPPDAFIVGTVGRMEAVKDPVNLARAFVLLLKMVPAGGRPLRLVMAGDGSLRPLVSEVLEQSGAGPYAWLAGKRQDIAEIMRGLDLFVLPSLGEGISNTVLEAMASGLPVVATSVGGNPELVRDGYSGQLVASGDPHAMARAMLTYYADPEKCRRHGIAARAIVEKQFSMAAMVRTYAQIYDTALRREARRTSL